VGDFCICDLVHDCQRHVEESLGQRLLVTSAAADNPSKSSRFLESRGNFLPRLRAFAQMTVSVTSMLLRVALE
jgi:hypothetical protein